MDGSLFRWVTSIKLSIVFAIFLASNLIGMAFAQDDSQNQAAIEQALQEALPKDEDLPGGIAWDPSNYRPEFLDISWTGHRISEECPYGSRTRTDEDNFYVRGSITQSYYESAEAFCSKHISVSSHGVAPSPYGNLPGGVIWEVKDDQSFEFEISFWKSPNISGNLRFNVVLATGCGRPTPERQAEAEAFVRSECERLAKLVYDRLPGGESTSGSEYDELRNVLAGYGREPGLWGDKKNATKALDLNKGPEDARIGFPTNKLLYYLLPKIIAVEKMADQLDLECNQPLYESQKGILDQVRPLLPSFEDLLKLPFGNLKKLCDIVKETSSYEFENYVVPKELEDVYKNYKAMGGGDTEEVKNSFASVGGYYTVAKEALGFKDKSDEEFYKICEYRFKLRYECEKSQSEIQYFRDNKKEIVVNIIVEYNPTLTKIEDNIRDLQSKSSQD